MSILSFFSPQKKAKKKFIIIMGAGRCGTTYVVNELNKIKGVNIFGENNNLFIDIIVLIKKINVILSRAVLSQKHSTTTYKNNTFINVEWFNDLKKLKLLQTFLLKFLKIYFSQTYDVVGFKEIRFDVKEHIEHLTFFESHYDVFYIHMTRNIDAQAQSAWWAQDPHAKENISKINQNIIDVFGSKSNYLRIDLAEIQKDINKIRLFIDL